jgi:hypothetical protein
VHQCERGGLLASGESTPPHENITARFHGNVTFCQLLPFIVVSGTGARAVTSRVTTHQLFDVTCESCSGKKCRTVAELSRPKLSSAAKCKYVDCQYYIPRANCVYHYSYTGRRSLHKRTAAATALSRMMFATHSSVAHITVSRMPSPVQLDNCEQYVTCTHAIGR